MTVNLPPAPPTGQMYLFDAVEPPLDDGSYRVSADTDVTLPELKSDGTTQATTESFTAQSYFDVVGPRFTVPPGMVAGTFPPTNSHGEFQNDLPHIVLSRRTLPWERTFDPSGLLPLPVHPPGQVPEPTTPVPWVALLVFEEGEYTLLHGINLKDAVPADVFGRLGSPSGITCDAVEADSALVAGILPSVEELQLLSHVRWVNVDDRELNTAGGDGFFSVVVSNRLPTNAAQYRAILVSLEERSDLVKTNPPAVAQPPRFVATVDDSRGEQVDLAQRVSLVPPATIDTNVVLNEAPRRGFDNFHLPSFVLPHNVRLVALASWQFTCVGAGTFRELMQHLDDSMLGTVAEPGHPALSDTGHLQMTMQDRLGDTESVWYRGPLAPYALTRDTLGPYHSADQARIATAETGVEDISYASAFEVGRLLAAADARLAQSLMKWRRESYEQAARESSINNISSRISLTLPLNLTDRLHSPIVPLISNAAATAIVDSGPPIADAWKLGLIANQAGLNTAAVTQAWKLDTEADAASVLASPGTLGDVVPVAPQPVHLDTTIGAVASDAVGRARLAAARGVAIDNARVTLGVD